MQKLDCKKLIEGHGELTLPQHATQHHAKINSRSDAYSLVQDFYLTCIKWSPQYSILKPKYLKSFKSVAQRNKYLKLI
jgi:hypothetical protein